MARKSVVKTAPNRFKADQIPTYLILLPVVLAMLLPVVYIVFHAFKPIDELFAFPPKFVTLRPTFANFRLLFSVGDSAGSLASVYIFNSVVSTALVVSAAVFMCAAGGYVLAKKRFRGRKLIGRLNRAALMFVSIAVALPLFLIVKQLGLLESFWAHVLPLLALPVGLFLVQQFVGQIPNSLIEAAQIDGCSDYGILLRVVMPVIKPALATVAILAFQASWGATEASQMFIESEKLKTFAYYLGAFTAPTGNSVTGQAMAAAAVLILFVPNVVLFVLMQSKVMNTVAYSGIK